MKKDKIIVVCGPTATGKSDYAVNLALEHSGEVISADSRQVYRGLDIGSGKITPEEMKGAPHHMIDVADPAQVFSVAEYISQAKKIVAKIISQGNLPIICGGTGFYINALIYNQTFPEVPPNQNLRDELEQKTLTELQQQLELIDSQRFQTIDINNKVRLIRAIEIATALGKVPQTTSQCDYNVEWHYLDFPDDVLKERIHTRLINRLNNGMVEEVHRLHKQGISWERLYSLGLEYRFIALYLQGKYTYEEMTQELYLAIWHYAKRQRTWFKKYAK